MDINRIAEFFYERASNRIKKKVKESKLKYAEIYKPDHKQISRIVNNERTKNNRFLICDAVISNSYKDETTEKYIECGLLNKLNFNSKKEILWGSDEEINLYLYDLFELLWTEVTAENSPYKIDSELYLCDYIPYAKYSTYWNILFSPRNKYPAITYGIYEDTVIEEIEPARENALLFLYCRCKNDFNHRFFSFIETEESFHKLDKVLKEKLIEKSFIPMLDTYKPDASSLGLRVRDLINADLSHCASIIFNESNNDSYFTSLINASSNYIVKLEEIQQMIFS